MFSVRAALRYLDFLRDYGQHFTINRMMNFESVKMRLDREQPLTFLEFNYMILQVQHPLQTFSAAIVPTDGVWLPCRRTTFWS